MKVLRVLGLIFGILLLLTGGGLLVGAVAADQGQSSVQQELANQGLKGPVQATVVSAENSTYTVRFSADGKSHTGTAGSTLSSPPKVGDKVSIFYKSDDPSVAVISDAPVNALGGIADTLRTAGIVTVVIGGLLLAAAILGFVLAKQKRRAVAAQPYPSAGQPVPAQNYPAQPSTYPGQPQAYPAQSQAYAGEQQSYPTPPPYPPQPPRN